MSDAEWSVANAAVKGVISVVSLYFVFADCRWVWRTLMDVIAAKKACPVDDVSLSVALAYKLLERLGK